MYMFRNKILIARRSEEINFF